MCDCSLIKILCTYNYLLQININFSAFPFALWITLLVRITWTANYNHFHSQNLQPYAPLFLQRVKAILRVRWKGKIRKSDKHDSGGQFNKRKIKMSERIPRVKNKKIKKILRKKNIERLKKEKKPTRGRRPALAQHELERQRGEGIVGPAGSFWQSGLGLLVGLQVFWTPVLLLLFPERVVGNLPPSLSPLIKPHT